MKKSQSSFYLTILCGIASQLTLASLSLAQDVITYYHTDLTGSTVAGSDANGNIIWREDYTPYGEKRLEQLSSGDNRRAFTGHPHEDYTGLTYAGARHYDPMIGRFTSVDPIGPSADNQFSFNRYVYANNNPFGYTDPDGREVVLVNRSEKEKFENWINSRALGHFEFNSNNKLTVTSAKGDFNHSYRSAYYSRRLIEAINSNKKIFVELASWRRRDFLDSNRGGAETEPYVDWNSRIIITGNANTELRDVDGRPLRDAPADILAHEFVAHAIPHSVSSDTGNAVMNENKVRREVRGGRQRAPESTKDHPEEKQR